MVLMTEGLGQAHNIILVSLLFRATPALCFEIPLADQFEVPRVSDLNKVPSAY